MIYYSYLWLRENGTPFYVGKGKGNRAFLRDSHLAKPPARERILIQYHPTEEEAFQAEMFFVAFYGRKDIETGILINRTNGGDQPPGNLGRKHSAEARYAIGAGNRGRKKTPEECKKISDAKRGRKINQGPRSLEAKIMMSARRRGIIPKHKHTDAFKQTLAERNRTRVWTTEMRAKISAARKKQYAR